MEIRTWRSTIADLKGSPPGAPSGALGNGTLGWVWRCDAAISRYYFKKQWGSIELRFSGVVGSEVRAGFVLEATRHLICTSHFSVATPSAADDATETTTTAHDIN